MFLHRMKMSEGNGKISRVTQSTQNLIKKQQNMKKLCHEVWDKKKGMYIKSDLPEEPTLKLRMCLEVEAYRTHEPYLKCSVRPEWIDSLGVSKQQKDIVLKTSTADTGA